MRPDPKERAFLEHLPAEISNALLRAAGARGTTAWAIAVEILADGLRALGSERSFVARTRFHASKSQGQIPLVTMRIIELGTSEQVCAGICWVQTHQGETEASGLEKARRICSFAIDRYWPGATLGYEVDPSATIPDKASVSRRKWLREELLWSKSRR
jgi:hypothetical protein